MALLSLQADLSSLPEINNSLVVFCMATYGEGDPTDNAQDFYDWLQETDVDLSGVKYAVSLPSTPVCVWDPVSKENRQAFTLFCPGEERPEKCGKMSEI